MLPCIAQAAFRNTGGFHMIGSGRDKARAVPGPRKQQSLTACAAHLLCALSQAHHAPRCPPQASLLAPLPFGHRTTSLRLHQIESEEDLRRAASVARELKLDGLVVAGGDDSNTNAAVLANYFLAAGDPSHLLWPACMR